MNLDQVVQRAKSDIAKGYVYVMMPIPQLETLLAGLEDLQRENAAMKEALEMKLDKQMILHWLNDRCDLYNNTTPLRPIRASEVSNIISGILSGRFDTKEEPA